MLVWCALIPQLASATSFCSWYISRSHNQEWSPSPQRYQKLLMNGENLTVFVQEEKHLSGTLCKALLRQLVMLSILISKPQYKYTA